MQYLRVDSFKVLDQHCKQFVWELSWHGVSAGSIATNLVSRSGQGRPLQPTARPELLPPR